MVIDQQNMLLARRGMYLAAYDQIIDAGSFCANFLIAIFDSLEFGAPVQVDITSTGHYIALTAIGCSLTLEPKETQLLSSIFDIACHQERFLPTTYPSLAFLQPLVWFSESCLMDISTAKATYHQLFMHGSQSALGVIRPRTDEPPRISFCFTLPADVFGKAPLTIARLKRVVSLWKPKDFLRALPERKKTLKLHFQWRRQSDDYFSLRITPDAEATPVSPLNPVSRPESVAVFSMVHTT